jgi:GTPase SAR1 family protein
MQLQYVRVNATPRRQSKCNSNYVRVNKLHQRVITMVLQFHLRKELDLVFLIECEKKADHFFNERAKKKLFLRMFDILQRWWIGKRVSKINQYKASVHLPTSEDAIEQVPVVCRVLVIGNESCGKSSVLARFTGARIFQTGEDIISRIVLHVKLRFGRMHVKSQMTFEFPGKKPVTSSSPDVIHDALKAVHDEIGESGKGVNAKDIGILTIYSNQLPNLDLIDCPGILSFAGELEPQDLPDIIRELITKQVQEGTIVLHITDAKSNPRNSASYQLIAQLQQKMKFPLVLVRTKIDCLVKHDLTNFLTKFYKEDNHSIAVSNYETDSKETLEEITVRETEFFQHNVPDYNTYKHRLGIHAVFNVINKIAKAQSRDQWAEKQYQLETKRMKELEALLENQGPLLTRDQLARLLVSEGILYEDPLLDTFLTKGWEQAKDHVPSNSFWSKPADIPFDRFLTSFELAFIERVRKCMNTNPQKLSRFENFTSGFIERFREKLNERKHYLQERWSVLQHAIQLQHDMGLHYEKNLWVNAMKSCLYTQFFMHLSNINWDIDNASNEEEPLPLEQQLLSLTIGLNVEETPIAAQVRQGLLLQIKELKERILPMLSPEDANEEWEDSD